MARGRPTFASDLERQQVMFCVETWHALGGERHLGMALGAIPFRAVVAWGQLHGLDREAILLLAGALQRPESDRMEREASAQKLRGER